MSGNAYFHSPVQLFLYPVLILLPALCSAQVILENVTKMCYLDKYIKKEECTYILSGMSNYIENDIRLGLWLYRQRNY